MRAYVTWKTDKESGHDIWENASQFYITADGIHVTDSGLQLHYPWRLYVSLLGGMYEK